MAASWKRIACLILSVWMFGNWASAVEPDVVIPLWSGDGLPPGAKVQDPQNQQPDAKGLIRRMRLLYWRVQGGGHSAFHKPSAWGKWMEQLMPWLKQQGFADRP